MILFTILTGAQEHPAYALDDPAVRVFAYCHTAIEMNLNPTQLEVSLTQGLVYESNGDPTWKPKSGLFYIDLEAVVVMRARVVRSRPALAAGWRLSFGITARMDQLPLPTLQQILEYAGQNVGIGDFRPRLGNS